MGFEVVLCLVVCVLAVTDSDPLRICGPAYPLTSVTVSAGEIPEPRMTDFSATRILGVGGCC